MASDSRISIALRKITNSGINGEIAVVQIKL